MPATMREATVVRSKRRLRCSPAHLGYTPKFHMTNMWLWSVGDIFHCETASFLILNYRSCIFCILKVKRALINCTQATPRMYSLNERQTCFISHEYIAILCECFITELFACLENSPSSAGKAPLFYRICSP